MSAFVLSTSRKHTTGFLEKSFGKCCGSTMLTASLLVAINSLYSCSDVCVRVGGDKSQPFTVGVAPTSVCAFTSVQTTEAVVSNELLVSIVMDP